MPAPDILPAQYRYAGDDWAGVNAFLFVAWQTPPVYASDGVTLVSAGVPLDITGFTPSGALYQRSILNRQSFDSAVQVPVAFTGTLTAPTLGQFQLTLARTFTGQFVVQDVADPYSLLELRAMLTDPSGNLGTIAAVPVFVL